LSKTGLSSALQRGKAMEENIYDTSIVVYFVLPFVIFCGVYIVVEVYDWWNGK
jgi:hypothetical protein